MNRRLPDCRDGRHSGDRRDADLDVARTGAMSVCQVGARGPLKDPPWRAITDRRSPGQGSETTQSQLQRALPSPGRGLPATGGGWL